MKTKCSRLMLLVHILHILLQSMYVSCVLIQKDNKVSKQYCGSTLSEILDDLCLEYNVPENYRKRSGGRFYTSYALSHPAEPPPFVDQKNAFSMLFTRRRRETAYDECCRKGCTIGELLQYCRVSRYTIA